MRTIRQAIFMLKMYGFKQTVRMLFHKAKHLIQCRCTSVASYRALRNFPKRSAIANRPIRVVFFAESSVSWDSFSSVREALSGDPRCITTVVCVNNYPAEHPSIETRLTEENIPFVKEAFFDIDYYKPDVALFHKQYENNKHFRFRFKHISKIVPRIAYISYGFPIAAGQLRQITQFNYPIQQLAWRVYVHSHQFKNLYGRYCKAGNNHVRAVGHPMVDALIQADALSVDSDMRDFCAGKKTIIWNPHYCETKEHNDCSTFMRWKDVIFDKISKTPGAALIFRPHPLLFGHLLRQQLMKKLEIDELMNFIEKSPGILYDKRHDYRQALAISDGMLSDISSFLTLYAATGKPIMYLHNPTGPGISESGKFVNDFYQGLCKETIEAFIDMVVKEEDPMKNQRNLSLKNYLEMPREGAGAMIANDIINACLNGT